MQISIELENVQLLVIFKLVGSVLRYFDYAAKHFGGTVANWQLQIVNHLSSFSFSTRGRDPACEPGRKSGDISSLDAGTQDLIKTPPPGEHEQTLI
jgi:hypothetical protein